MKVLVLGGTGAMGMHLVSILADEGHCVIVTSRTRRENRTNVTYVMGDAHNDSFVSGLLSEYYDAIIDFMSYKTAEFYGRYKKYLDATNQYVFLSSARVYADSGNSTIHEDYPRLLDICTNKGYLRTDEYALTKARQEDILFDSKRRNWTIIRPYITYSETRLQLGVLEKEHWLYRALHGRSIVFSEDIANNVTTLTYGFDVSKAIAAIIGQKDAIGEAFRITGEDYLKWNDVLGIYMDVLEKVLGTKPKVVYTAKSLRLRYPEAKWQVIYDRYFCRKFDNSKISKFVDVHSFVNPIEGLKFCLEQFLRIPKFLPIHWKEEGVMDFYCNEFAASEEFQTKDKRYLYSAYRTFPSLALIDILRQKVKMIIKG